ncbi:hypothetical protein HLV40_15390 [Chromohalobacter salexigens]|nr:hypothetical protein [Chromohalobacter salexigens]
MSETVRIRESEIDQVSQSDFDLIAAVGPGEDGRPPKEREVKSDKRMPPFASRDTPGTDMTPKVLLVEVENPGDMDTIQSLRDRMGVYQPTSTQA